MARVKTDLPKGVWFAPKRLATGERVRYGYFGRGPGTIALGREGTPDFHVALAEAMRKGPIDGTMASLVCAYRGSKTFERLEPRTQADYRRHLDLIQRDFGTLSLAAMASPRMADHIEGWRDGLDASPRQADYAATVLKLVLAWGVRRGRLAFNRAAGLEKIYRADRSEKRWSADQGAAFLEVAPEPMARALILAEETGISQGDLLQLPKTADCGHIIIGRRHKTGVAFAIPVSPRLRNALDSAPATDAVQILTKADGRPWDPKGNGFRQAWRTTCAEAGVEGVTFNDLRGTFITHRRSQMGWSAEEVALCSGHPIQGEKGAQRSYADRMAIAVANAERLHARSYGSNNERNLQTGMQTAIPEGEVSA